jgi:RNA polymerase sigma-70 factor, ECF subfamily
MGQADVELIERIAGGHCAALAELYDRHALAVLALLRRFFSSQEDCEEILQEVFLHVWRQAGVYDPGRSAVPTWLAMIARSRAIDRLRSQRTLDRTLAHLQRQPPPDAPGPEAWGPILDDQRRRRIRRAMAALPAEQRRVLKLAFYDGRTQTQIARTVDVPLGTVKTRTVLGMRKLRRALRAEVRQLL